MADSVLVQVVSDMRADMLFLYRQLCVLEHEVDKDGVKAVLARNGVAIPQDIYSLPVALAEWEASRKGKKKK